MCFILQIKRYGSGIFIFIQLLTYLAIEAQLIKYFIYFFNSERLPVFFIKYYNMNKCEHGQKIGIFCASDCCVWKQAAGCDFCMKKYHNHMGPTIFLSEQQVAGLVKKYTMESNIKPKCRVLQQAIYSYFNLVKTQITNSIDVVCKTIINQTGYPFLHSNNTLSTYKRLKNKEYKKVIQKQFKNLYELSQKTTEKELVKEESKIYFEEIKSTEELLASLQEVFKSYQSAVKKTFTNFTHDRSYFIKISQILKTVNIDSPSKNSKCKENKEIQLTKPQIISNTAKEKISPKPKAQHVSSNENSPSRLPIINIAPPLLLKPNYGRNVSIDKKIVKEHTFDLKAGKQKSKEIVRKQDNFLKNSKVIAPNDKLGIMEKELNYKQIQLNEKKRKLIELMKQKEDSIKNVKQKSNLEILQKKENENIKSKLQVLSFFKRQLSQKSAIKADEVDTTQQDINFKTQNDQSQQNSHNQLQQYENGFKQDETQVQQHAFTQLPLFQNDLKNSTEIQEVKQKVILIPNTSELQQLAYNYPDTESPILKKRNQSMASKSKQISPQNEKNEEAEVQTFKLNENLLNKLIDTLQLKQNEQKSLALLLKSLTLNAQQAVKYLQSALSQAENNLSAAQYLSFLYLQQDKPQNCLHLCNKILEKLENSIEPDQLSLIINNNKAAALNVLGRYSQSIMILERCLKYKEKDFLFKNLGDAYFSISIYEKAVYNYEKALRINQYYDEAQYNLSVCLYIQENYFNAKLSIKKALQIQPQNPKYLQLLANIDIRINHC